MIINRHNYEEFFILYLDNELSSEDRSMVEAFVQNHPDLKEELDILFQFKLEPDTNIVFEGKEELMMMGANVHINSNNYEEWLTLYIDNELTAEQKKSVEQYIKANPVVAAELTLLQKTKLQPETIVFADKQSLYRREEKVRRLPVLWWRAVAAVLILALGLTTFFTLNKKPATVKDPVATTTGAEEKNNKQTPVLVKENNQPEQKIEEQQTPLQQVANNVENVFAKQNNNRAETKKENNGAVSKLKEIITAPVKNDDEIIAENNDKPTNNLPQPINTNRTVTADVAKNNNNNTVDISTTLTNPKVTNTTTPPSDYTYASNDDALDQSTGKKSKLRGFFRKVTRTFEKRTNIDPTDDEERLLVGGLAIRLK